MGPYGLWPHVGLLGGAQFRGCRGAALRAEFLAELRPALKPLLTIGAVAAIRAVMIVVAFRTRLVVVAEWPVAGWSVKPAFACGTLKPALAGGTVKAAFTRRAIGKLLATALVAVVVETVARLIVETIVAAVGVVVAFATALVAITRLIVAPLLIIEAGLAILEPLRWRLWTRVFKARLLFGLAWRQIGGRQRLHVATERLAFILTVIVGVICRLAGSVYAARTTVFATLGLAFAIGEDNAIIVFGVLEIVFSKNRVA